MYSYFSFKLLIDFINLFYFLGTYHWFSPRFLDVTVNFLSVKSNIPVYLPVPFFLNKVAFRNPPSRFPLQTFINACCTVTILGNLFYLMKWIPWFPRPHEVFFFSLMYSFIFVRKSTRFLRRMQGNKIIEIYLLPLHLSGTLVGNRILGYK